MSVCVIFLPVQASKFFISLQRLFTVAADCLRQSFLEQFSILGVIEKVSRTSVFSQWKTACSPISSQPLKWRLLTAGLRLLSWGKSASSANWNREKKITIFALFFL